MKHYLILAFALCIFSVTSKAETSSEISIEDIVSKVQESHAIKVVGWDRLVGIRDSVPDATAILSLIAKSDMDALSKTVADSTDYECVKGEDYWVVVPKSNPELYTLPVSKRIINVPNASKVSEDEFLKCIRYTQTNDDRFFLLIPTSFMAPHISGSISTQARKAPCYEVLNDMARQLKASAWIVASGSLEKPKSGEAINVEKLGTGQVRFY